jgi:hypothetical protein
MREIQFFEDPIFSTRGNLTARPTLDRIGPCPRGIRPNYDALEPHTGNLLRSIVVQVSKNPSPFASRISSCLPVDSSP